MELLPVWYLMQCIGGTACFRTVQISTLPDNHSLGTRWKTLG